MQEEINTVYRELSDTITKKELKKEFLELLNESENLFDEKTVGKLILEKYGKNKKNVTNIKDIKNKKECTILGKITKIGTIRNFNKKNNSKGKVVNLEISDNTGFCNLVLWDKDVKFVENKKIKIGTNLRVINGYVKNGYHGLEINIGKYGLLKFEEDLKLNVTEKLTSISGEIIEIEKTKPFFRENGEFGFVTNIKIKTKNNFKKITLWDKKVKEIQNFKIGDNIKFENIDIKNNNGSNQIHINGNSKIFKI